MTSIKLSKEAVKALIDYNLETKGRGVVSTDPYIERLKQLAMPGESLSDVIVRLYRQGGGILPE